MTQRERIVVVHWEGPYQWAQCQRHKRSGHVLYAIHGAHHLYGRDVLLYLGKSDGHLGRRLHQHGKWVADEYDAVTVRLASIGFFKSWADWERGERYPQARPFLVSAVEALLIRAHQPAYNSSSKGSLVGAKDLRIMNTGHLGHLLPEVSYLYHGEE